MCFWLFLTKIVGVNENLGVERHQRGGGGVEPTNRALHEYLYISKETFLKLTKQ